MPDLAELFFLHLDSEPDDEFYRSDIDFGCEETFFSPQINNDSQITCSFDFLDRNSLGETLEASEFGTADDSLEADNPWLELGLGFEIGDELDEIEIHGSINHDRHQDEGLHVIGFDIGSEPNSNRETNFRSCLGFEEDCDWEEVDGCDDERDFWSMMGGDNQEDNNEEDEEEVRNWEILLSINNGEMMNNTVVEEDDDFVNPNEYEILFGQFDDYVSAIRGTPPAAKLVVDNLPSVVLSEEDAKDNVVVCAVCKDEFNKNERMKKLPCMHFYHGECILPWLEIRNTCPVCRFELPTDNAEYERWKNQRRERDHVSIITEDDRRYDFNSFSDTVL